MVRVFNNLFEANRKKNILQRDLQTSIGFNTMATFNYLDQESFGFLDKECFELFMEEISMELTDDLLNSLMRVMDPLGKGRLSYSDFVAAVTPFVRSLSPVRLRASTSLGRLRPRSVSRPKKTSLDDWYESYISRSASKRRQRELESWYDSYLLKAEKDRIKQQVWYESYLAS